VSWREARSQRVKSNRPRHGTRCVFASLPTVGLCDGFSWLLRIFRSKELTAGSRNRERARSGTMVSGPLKSPTHGRCSIDPVSHGTGIARSIPFAQETASRS
jgi:hypothetical protein